MDAKEREEREERAMPEVFTGKVLIPGDQIDDYLAAMNVILLALWSIPPFVDTQRPRS